MKNTFKALFAAALVFGAALPVSAQTIPGGGGGAGTPAPCSAFGTTAGTCIQGAGAGGTPSSINLSNGTALPVSTGISGLATGIATFLTTPSSANLATAMTDETGTGANVFANGPTLVAPVLGTPASGNLANTTGFPTANLSGLGTGIATFLATPSSANLAAALTDETGTGAAVFAGSPTFTGTISGAAETLSGTLTLSALSGTNCLQEVSGGVGSFGSPCAPNGIGAVVTTSQTPSAADWAAFKTFVLNGNSLSVTVPVSTTLQANGGGYLIIAQGTSDSLVVTSPDTLTYGSTTSGAGGNQALTQGGLYVVLTDGAGKVHMNLIGAGGGGTPCTTTALSVQFNNAGSFGCIAGLTVASGLLTLSATPIASNPALNITGNPFSGTATTSRAALEINEAAATASTTRTAVTGFFINHHGAGPIIDGQTDGSDLFQVTNGGAVIAAGSVIAGNGFNCFIFGQAPGSGQICTPGAVNGDLMWEDNGAASVFEASKVGIQCYGTIPTVTGTATPAITTGSTDCAGEVTTGTAATSIVIHSADAAVTTAPFCTVSSQTALATNLAYTITVSASHWLISVTTPATTGGKIDYVCNKNGP